MTVSRCWMFDVLFTITFFFGGRGVLEMYVLISFFLIIEISPQYAYLYNFKINTTSDFLGDPMVKNVPTNAGDMDFIPSQERCHMSQGN